jgi:hypothetical protein
MLPLGWAGFFVVLVAGSSQTIPVLSQFNLFWQNFANQTGPWLARPDQDSKFKLV